MTREGDPPRCPGCARGGDPVGDPADDRREPAGQQHVRAAQLLKELPDDPELNDTRDWLKRALGHEAHVDKKSSHRPFLWWGAGSLLLCLVFTYLVMQPPGDGEAEDKARSLFILLAVIYYVVGAAVFVHGAHLLGRRYHLFSGSVPEKP